MDEEYRRVRPPSDLSEMEVVRLAHYRQLTLEDPDEIWVEQTELGERHFTYIARFRSGDERLSYVVVCLTIEGVPSFVFFSFATRDEGLVDEYRRGVELKLEPDARNQDSIAGAPGTPEMLEAHGGDASPDAPLALREGGSINPEGAAEVEGGPDDEGAAEAGEGDDLSNVERLYLEARQPSDIPRDQFERFERFIEPVLDEPDEIWRFVDHEGNEWCTFIARVDASVSGAAPEEAPRGVDDIVDEFTMIVVCEPAAQGDAPSGESAYSVLFAFPTIDPGLVQHFRKGVNSLNKAFGIGWARGRAA